MDSTIVKDNFLYTVTHISVEKNDGSVETGTGFIYHHDVISAKDLYYFLVTSGHLFVNAKSFSFQLLKADVNYQPILGSIQEPYDFNVSDTEVSEIYFHPQIDIAIFPFTKKFKDLEKIGAPPFFKTIRPNLIPNDSELKKIDLLEDVYFIGYPIGYYDEYNYLPIARKGVIASPIDKDFNGEPKFMIDASVYEGSSGSPVFYIKSVTNDNGEPSQKLFFLGLISDTIFNEENIKAPQKEPGELKLSLIEDNQVERLASKLTTEQNIDLGVVFRSEKVLETVELYLKEKNM